MDIRSQPTSVFAALAITRIVDGRCYSLPNLATTRHPALILFGRGPPNNRLMVLDNGLLNGSVQVLAGGAWSMNFKASAGCHSFCVCTSDGVVSSPWEIIVELPPPPPPPTVAVTADADDYSFWRRLF